MNNVILMDSPSQGEEYVISRDVCNFSTITEHTHEQSAVDIVWYSNVIVLPIIAFIGLTCNLLNILILTSNRGARRMPSWTLLFALAVCDCVFLVFAVLDVTPMSITTLAFHKYFNRIYYHSVLYIRTIASTFYKTSVLVVVAFNVERFICVIYPLKSHSVCTGRTSRMAIYTCFLISLLCSLQWPLCYDIHPCYDASTDSEYFLVLLKENDALRFYYRCMDYIALFGFNILPIVSLLVMNYWIILTLKKVAVEDQRREEETTRLADGALVQEPSHRLNANAMLFAVVLMLFVCVGPQAPARLLIDVYGQYHSISIVYTCMSQQLVFLNASLNFFLYCVVSKRYRTLMKQTLKRLMRSVAIVDRPLKMSVKQSKSSSAHGTSLDDHHNSRNMIPL